MLGNAISSELLTAAKLEFEAPQVKIDLSEFQYT